MTKKENIDSLIEKLGYRFEALELNDGDWTCYYKCRQYQENVIGDTAIEALTLALIECEKGEHMEDCCCGGDGDNCTI